MPVNKTKIFLLLISFIFSYPNQNPAQSIFDSNFGINGIAIPQIRASNVGLWSLSLQKDKKIVAAGWAYTDEESPSDISVVRLFEDGEQDTSFNSSGLFSIGNGTWEDAYATAIQSDGKILIGGRHFRLTNWDFIIFRLNEDGTLDSSFGTNGFFIKDFFGKDDRLFSMDIQSDGKIVACGFAEKFNWDFAIIRLNSDGKIDSTFGNNGSKVINIGSYNDVAFSIKAQNDGKIIICGWTYIFGSWDFALVRLNSDGSLDNSFGSTGIVTTDYHHLYNTAHSVAIQSDGKYILAGYTFKPGFPDYDVMLVRYNYDGTVDKSFGDNGIVLADYDNADDFAWVVKTDSYDKILVGGIKTIDGLKNLLVARFNSDGSPDISFGKKGSFDFNFFGFDEEVRDLLIQPDGKILLTGYYSDRKTQKAFVVRLDNPYNSINNKPEILLNNFPNPFNSSTKISYIIPTNLVSDGLIYSPVTIKVYDLLGREIETLVDGFQEPGYYEVQFPSNKESENLSSGIYFYRIDINGISQTKKMLLVR
ncbi:T9SS type A sorting domain-containing protein [Ignavibacterium album]|uniref:T9SS type A sorting domain-containing protein n=1 Tax=Ignavibacterium album TaxID=591197 RepID=UPI0002D876AC|nr:T9SS type A sorting domain-containing protein [Ignavibacterium album]